MAKAKKTVRKRAKAKKTAVVDSKAIVVSSSPGAVQIIAPTSVVPKIMQAVEDMERVRRFVSNCLNVDLKRELAKLAKNTKLKPEEKAKQEIELRDRLETDWGTIPGVDKPFLKQPGAEKFLLWLNIRPKYFNREAELSSGYGHLEIVSHVILYAKKSSEEVFEGPDCSCTTMESNYRFRWAKREIKPPQEDADKLKAAGLGKWKKEWVRAHGKPAEQQWVWFDRIENPNIHDERNKVRQIGEKRALVKCVRNMGAISEIFTSDPSEWEQETVEDGSPSDDQDFTPSGRRIVNEQGVSPSGKFKTYEAEQREQKEAQAKVVQDKMAQTKASAPKGTLEVRWTGADRDVAQLGGTGLPALLTELKKECMVVWLEQAKANVVPHTHLKTVQAIALKNGYDYVEIGLPASPSPADSAGPQSVGAGAVAAKEEGSPTPRAAAPSSVTGIIRKVYEDVTAEKHIPILRVNIGGAVLGCFDKKLWEFLKAGDGKDAELNVKGARRDIVGIVRINRRMFEEGYLPIISNSEDRPEHIGALFT